MNENWNLHFPEALHKIRRATEAAGFRMASDELTGSLLRSLAASKPKGALLELGTGTGMGTSWLLSGMDGSSTLDTVDNDGAVVDIARRYLGHDSRVRFHVADGATFLAGLRERRFDLIFADTWPGKFDHLDDALSLLRPGGLYIVDDLLPQPSWPDGHAPRIPAFLNALEQHPDLYVTRLAWSTGLVIATKRPDLSKRRETCHDRHPG
jgi:predicted O-methyltransferase YrrM